MTTSTVSVRDAVKAARWVDLAEGEVLTGRVLRLPAPGAYAGTRLFIRKAGGQVVSIAAAARRGWTVLENALADNRVCVGDRVSITFCGWRETSDNERRYRDVRLEVTLRASRPGQVGR